MFIYYINNNIYKCLSECGMFAMSNVKDEGCLRCGIFERLDVWNLECRIWDVSGIWYIYLQSVPIKQEENNWKVYWRKSLIDNCFCW